MRHPPPAIDRLASALRRGDEALRRLDGGWSFAAASDPLRLDLPPLPPLPAEQLSSAALGALGALYLHANLEEAGVLATVENLVEVRRSLRIASQEAMDLLERYADRRAEHWSRAEREDLFARVFGIGPAARLTPGRWAESPAERRTRLAPTLPAADLPHNLNFQQALGRLAGAVLRADEARDAASRLRAGEDTLLRIAARALLDNLAAHRHGNVLAAARLLHGQVKEALTLLGHPGLAGPLGARTAWEALEKLSAGRYPGQRELARRGTSGQALLVWLGSVATELAGRPERPLAVEGPLARAAANWWLSFGIAIGRPPGAAR